jgi:hypothetical protein
MVNEPYTELKKVCPGVGEGEEATHFLLSEQIKADKELSNRVKHL